MKLNITGLKEKAKTLGPGPDGTYAHIGAQGGTEMMAERIRNSVPAEILGRVHIIHSRVRPENLHPTKPNILVMHDTWDDPENEYLKDKNILAKIAKIVFVSNFQQATFNMGLGIPYSKGVVIQNAIDPIDVKKEDKDSNVIRCIYHTTPHRGLELLVPAFEKVCEVFPMIHLDVYSSFKIYGWEARDEPYKNLFERIQRHPNMEYHGFQRNGVVREALKKSHIFAYPNIWPETSCIAAIEALDAKCNVVCPNHYALPETCSWFASLYPFDEDVNVHASRFANVLLKTAEQYWSKSNQDLLEFQKIYYDNFYAWSNRAKLWEAFLKSFS